MLCNCSLGNLCCGYQIKVFLRNTNCAKLTVQASAFMLALPDTQGETELLD